MYIVPYHVRRLEPQGLPEDPNRSQQMIVTLEYAEVVQLAL